MEENGFLSFALPSFGEEEIDSVAETLRSGWCTTGPKTKEFEDLFSDYIGSKYALAVNSATAGLHLALDAIGVKRGDKVITVSYTFTATAEVIRYMGADPIFVDIDPHTFNIDTNKLESILDLNPDVKAIMPVHFAGQAVNMDEIMRLADCYNVRVIEDAAHALPATYKNRMIGTIGDVTVYSFYATKTLATGEGGMIVTNNPEYVERIRTMRLHGINRDSFDRYSAKKPSWYYEVVAPGYKYNMTDISASIGIHQLAKCDLFQKRRASIAKKYDEALTELPLKVPYVSRLDDTHAWHLYVIQLELENLKINRDQFIDLIYEEGIGLSVHFIPLHLHPYWRDEYNLKPNDFPVSYNVYRRAVSLPIYPKMTDCDIDRVISTVRRILVENIK